MLPQNGQHGPPQGQSYLPSGIPPGFNMAAPSGGAGLPGAGQYPNLDPTIAKQMAALNAASISRMANNRPSNATALPAGGASSAPYLGNLASMGQPADSFNALNNSPSTAAPGSIPGGGFSSQPHHQQQPSAGHGSPPQAGAPFDPAMAHNAQRQQAVQMQQVQRQKTKGFLMSLANVMAQRGSPLPPPLTGVAYPAGYDVSKSPFTSLDIPQEGIVRIAGRDVDLFKLWSTVVQQGGGCAKLNASNGWNTLVPYFGLPEQLPIPQPNGNTSTATTLQLIYMSVLSPFEEMWRRNAAFQQQRARQAIPGAPGAAGSPVVASNPMAGMSGNGMSPSTRQSLPPTLGASSINGSSPFPLNSDPANVPHPSHIRSASGTGPQGTPQAPIAHSPLVNGSAPPNLLDNDPHALKRKMEADDTDMKRVRQRLSSEPLNGVTGTGAGAGLSSTLLRDPKAKTRRMIKYIPLQREVDTYGGRELHAIEEGIRASYRRGLRDIHEWGNVDIDHLTMSIRSRLSTELSYGLTTTTLLSTMKGQTPGSGFPIFQCEDLYDELLDLLEDEAFPETDVNADLPTIDEKRTATFRELMNTVQEQENELFVSTKHRPGYTASIYGVRQRPANFVLMVVRIILNFSLINDNREFLARHERTLDLILRVCGIVERSDGVQARSPFLSLNDVLVIRKEVLFTLINICPTLQLATMEPDTLRRLYDLLVSYLVDPTDAISPIACVRSGDISARGDIKPPVLPDLALEILSRIAQEDDNRRVLSQSIKQNLLLTLFKALVYRLPVADVDYQVVTHSELWLNYLYKLVMTIYSLTFLCPPELKKKLRSDRALALSAVLSRVVQRCMVIPGQIPERREIYVWTARRAVETLKLLDSCADSFDVTSQVTGPAMAFGMGWSDPGEGVMEAGTGILASQQNFLWEVMTFREMDAVMFGELESTLRLE